MSLRSHLSFANVASATALVVALAGGGVAVAAGLAKNSVGSAQVKSNSLKSGDIKNDNLKGKDIKESTLSSVPAVDTVASRTATAAMGSTATIYTKGTFVVELECIDDGGGNVEARVVLRTTADNAFMDANDEGDEFSDFDVASGAALIVSESDTARDGEDGGFGALSPSGKVLTGHAFAIAKPDGGNTCLGGGSFIS